MLGLRAGLVRIRDYDGIFSIQLWAKRSLVARYLMNALDAMEAIGERGYSVRIGNLFYSNNQASLSWNDFTSKVKAGAAVLGSEGQSQENVGDNPFDLELVRRIDRRLRDLGINI